MANRWRTSGRRATSTTCSLPIAFGDYYTRAGLSDAARELATFFYLVAQGGVDGPATAHAGANMNLGTTREFLKRCVLVMVPLVGYPRSLAALAAIKNAAESRNS
ncbi:carboxymuconolactone decarboxylase family protein [Corynebacterium rouxii]|uniref:Carboxymuconolactone decarboxylase family protein n=1 Tax=Corynebacterium rouxii TaxID=2719119 RepID=A0ABU3PQC1_9CORY|nr:carboxymuconolactone decarboxylase family protein [Corynebacterium rouxii]MDT9409731.1 carboxymuconolactone decarboxylase family protein [Corynebacterium rouxii]MDT9411964.1 carboxymuconolactone decarboxylase family protein [Corynebacterium rouxii]